MGWLPSPEWSYWRYCHRVPDQRQKAPEKKKKKTRTAGVQKDDSELN